MTDETTAIAAATDSPRALATKTAMANMLADVAAHRGEVSQFLKPFGVEYEFFESSLRLFLTKQLQDAPDFFTSVTAVSFMEALLRIAMNGLLADGKEAAIAHYKGRATALFMRDGLVKTLWRTGMVASISDQTVTRAEYQSGKFEYREGDDGYVRHTMDLDRKDTDEIVAAYCVVKLRTGESMREVVPQDELRKIALMSRSPARKSWAHQMHRKAAIRRIMGKMPREKAIVQLLEHDDLNYDLNAPALTERTPSGVAARLPGPGVRPGFAPGHVDTQVNPLSKEALDERLGGDDIPAEAEKSPLAGVSVPAGDDAAETREAPDASEGRQDGAAERVRDFLAGESAPSTEPAPDLEGRIDAYLKALDAAATVIKLKAARDRAHQLRDELAESAPERSDALDAYFNRRHAELSAKPRPDLDLDALRRLAEESAR